MEAINIKAFTKDSGQIEALKAFMKALKIKFEVSKNEIIFFFSAENTAFILVQEIPKKIDHLLVVKLKKVHTNIWHFNSF